MCAVTVGTRAPFIHLPVVSNIRVAVRTALVSVITRWKHHGVKASTTADERPFMAALEPRNFLQPCLLLLLREQSDHGYELASRLRPMHDGEGDPGSVYRALRSLERQGLVRSHWCTSDVGPARRTYEVTADGVACLDAHAKSLEQIHQVLHVFLDRYARVVAAARPAAALA